MGAEIPKRFNLIRWFSLVSFAVITTVVISLTILSTRFLLIENVRRDGLLTAQAVHAIAAMERYHAAPGMAMPMEAGLAGPGQEGSAPGGLPQALGRREFLEHVVKLPDVQLASLYGPDRVIFWSSDPQLIGKKGASPSLEEAFDCGDTVTASHFQASGASIVSPPASLQVEHYIPFEDGAGRVAALLELHKEPVDLLAYLQRSYLVFWLAAVLGGVLIYLGLFWMIWRLSGLLAAQQRQLVANETVVALGEMSSAVAHSLRNPLAAIRSSAELALDAEALPVRKNIEDIISQVDRLSKCIRELLISSRPLCGEREAVDPVAAVDEVLQAFERQIRSANIQVDWQAQPAPVVLSHRLLFAQVLNSVISNAIEAMPRGGSLRVRIAVDALERRLRLTIGDSGNGMTKEQMAMAFKAFYTTKRGGLGVGLVLVKRIMERFGGAIRLDSREKEGTDVCLVFRIAEGG
ncbi:sensor histidine kinase [Azotobacter chroococcum]|uniref:histidine kinase n=1 Tax=Azotobacter chroococcum NCIMB 8003 TaxID=1328314 RepID=A0A0C4WM18_9GAMM|nr:HAMP domain-containing sensor histidine kinase [Azotobacter chroococcum]AJE21331.1 periplasmic sensory histidine protein kinase, two-component [Azotobacter chroococcum NCIMB 8003]